MSRLSSTAVSTEMDQWLRVNALGSACWRLRVHGMLGASKQIQDYQKPESHQTTSMKVRFQDSDGAWQFHHGILPSFGYTTSRKAMGTFGGAVFWMDEL